MKFALKTLTTLAVSITAALSMFGASAVAHEGHDHGHSKEGDNHSSLEVPPYASNQSFKNSSPLVLQPDPQRPSFWLSGDRATFVATSKDTGGQFSLFDVFIPPQAGTTPHVHSREDEASYILQGEVSYQLGDQTFTATPGNFVFAPKGTPMAFKNQGTTPARMLLIATPSGLENLFAAVGLPAGINTPPPPPPPLDPALFDRVLAIASQYGVDAPDSLLLTDSKYSVNEDGTPIASVTAFRPGRIQGSVSATINLSDGTATFPQDYSENQILVNFADGQRIQTVFTPIINDTLAEGNETINLSLSNPTAGAILGLLQNTATLTIVDDDAASSEGGLTFTNSGSNDTLTSGQSNPLLWSASQLASTVATGKDTKGQFSLFDLLIPPQPGSSQYISSSENNAYYILDGDVSFNLGEQTITATPETFVYLPKGYSYTFTNSGTKAARMILLTTPGSSPTSIPEPSPIWSLLALAALGAVTLSKNKLQNQKIFHYSTGESARLISS